MNPREYLSGLEFHGIKLGLENIRVFLDAASNPYQRYPIVHVGGTNGKGSVVAILSAILRAADYRVGQFTSPHLINLNERFVVNGCPIDDPTLDDQIAFFQEVSQGWENPPTYFELCTAVAFRWFADVAVDVAVVEVGMGGRFDSTNVVAPVACAITNVDLEHTQYLGTTIEAVAFEKAGIIKPGVPVIVAERGSEALAVIQERARACSSPIRLLDRDFRYTTGGQPFSQTLDFAGTAWRIESAPLGLAGRYQGDNAATALALAEVLEASFTRLNVSAGRAGLATARWPCRMERVLASPPVILDVAHNPAGMRRLAAELSKCIVVLAVSSDKAAAEMVAALDPLAHELILTQFSGTRSTPVAALRAAAGSRSHRWTPTLEEAIAQGMQMASDDCPLVITGSIYTAGQARTILMERHGAPPLRF